MQYLILLSLGAHEAEWQILVLPEQRLKVREGKYRIPDAMVIAARRNGPTFTRASSNHPEPLIQ